MNELPHTDLQQMLQSAVIAHRAGDLDEVEETCRAVLDRTPEQADALHLLGLAAHQQNRNDEAVSFLERAIAAHPEAPQFHLNLGRILVSAGRLEEAEASLRAALDMGADNAPIYEHLGVVLQEQGRYDDALEALAAALELAPDAHLICRRMAEIFAETERLEEAATHYRRYLDADPDDAEALGNLGRVFVELMQYDNAATSLRRAIELDPQDYELYPHLGDALIAAGKHQEAVDALRPAYADRPDDPALAIKYGSALYLNGDVDESREVAQRVYEANQSDPGALEILAVGAMSRNEFASADGYYEKILALDPSNIRAITGLIQAKNFSGKPDEAYLYARMAIAHPEFSQDNLPACLSILRNACDFEAIAELGDIIGDGETMRPDLLWGYFLMILAEADTPERRAGAFRAHRRWGEHVERMAAVDPLPPLDHRERDGKLRVGIMSSDFRVHAVTKFIMPIFRLHDREKLELYCYSSRTMADDPIQKEIRESVEKFVPCEKMNEKTLAAAIREDGIDVLIDLNGHTKDSYLITFAYRAAPIQLTWLGYPYTSGLKDSDYVLVDPYLRPEGEGRMTESPLPMPETAYCFDAGEEVEIELPMPFERNGFVTFGTLGNPYKFTPEAVAAWATVMRASPGSRFLVVRPGANSPVFVRNMCTAFAGHNIEADRLYFVDNSELDVPHYSFYNEIDICLDTFPLTGGTTTCEALWMGAPVVSLYGPNMYERISYAILNQLGLEELCTRTAEEFVEVAAALARDGDRLRRYRETLRPRMLESPLCQDEKFVRDFEELLIGVARRRDLI